MEETQVREMNGETLEGGKGWRGRCGPVRTTRKHKTRTRTRTDLVISKQSWLWSCSTFLQSHLIFSVLVVTPAPEDFYINSFIISYYGFKG